MDLGTKLESYRLEVLMKNLQSACFNRCCTSLSSNELTMDEVNCIDRCAWKYLNTHKIVVGAIERGGGDKRSAR